jgi:hypothetical protein
MGHWRSKPRASIGIVIASFGAIAWLVILTAQAPTVARPAISPARGVAFAPIRAVDLKEWLTYLASDELEGRQVFTEGYGIASEFIAEHLRTWGVQPLGDHGTYFQLVRLRAYRVVRHSTVTVQVNGESRTFADGDHVSFPVAAGGKRTLTFDSAEIIGSPPATDRTRSALSGRLVLALEPVQLQDPDVGPSAQGPAATITYAAARPPATKEHAVDAGAVGADADIPLTPQRVDGPRAPELTGDATFFEALFLGAPVKFSDLEDRERRGVRFDPIQLGSVHITISVDNVYEPVVTRLTRNVVGMVRGTDPALSATYVMFGAHLDHVGYAVNDLAQHLDGSLVGGVQAPIATDKIWNGADDDGTGSTAELALAQAFAKGPRPKRSVVFIWHAGEEAGLYGSLYNADNPVVPLDKVQCLLNIDMIGRNRDNDPRQANTLFVIGADRISTDLHNIIVDTNATLAAPLTLDYEYNDPADPNSFYTRSDHYSYASKGIPIAFFFTGTHPDYHANSDSVDKILFDKQARIADLIYRTGFSIADAPASLERDNRGPRAGRGFSGRLARDGAGR